MISENKTIFFDLDDTLYFRRDAFFAAFEEFFQSHKSLFPQEAHLIKSKASDCCRIRGDEVFFQCQKGEISTEEMYVYRFTNGFGDVGIKITESQALEFYALYKKALYEMKLNSEVVRMLDFAKSHFKCLGIMTNGESDHQRNKIKNLGLEKWISPELIVISGEHGCPKPEKRLFEIAREKARAETDKLVIIGDSFQNDILPAHTLGWHTIWINLYGEDFKAPEFEVKDVKEIPKILEKLA